MLRILGGLIVGLVAGSVVNMLIVILSMSMYPPPPGLDYSDTTAFQAYIASLPTAAFGLVFLAHAGGTFAASLVAAVIARRRFLILGAALGAWFFFGGLYNVLVLPAPPWFEILDLVAYLPCGLAGAKLGQAFVGKITSPPSRTESPVSEA